MALTYSIKKRSFMRNAKRNLVDVTIGVAGDYSSGLTLTPSSLGVTRIDNVQVAGTSGAANPVAWTFDISTGKLRAYKGNGAAPFTEVAGSDVATGVVRVEVEEYVNA